MYFEGTYTCGYCGCDDTLYFRANSEEEVNTYMLDGIYDYAANNIDVAYTDGYTDEEFDDFLNDCYIDIEEVTDMDDLEGEEIIDLTE